MRKTASKSASVTSRKSAALKNACVVDQHVDAAKGCHRLRHQRIDLRLLAHVAMNVQATEFAGQRGAPGVVDVGYDKLGAFACEAANAGFANTLGATGNDAHPARQPKGNFRRIYG